MFAAASIVFVVLVRLHARARERERIWQARVYAQELRAAAAARAWDALPRVSALTRDLPHYAHELDLVGEQSLLRLLAPALTTPGQQAFESWLFSPPSGVGEIELRQGGVRELAEHPELVDDLQLDAILAPRWPLSALEPFLEWSDGGAGATVPRFWSVLAWGGGVAASASLLLAATGVLPWGVPVLVLLVTGTVSLALGKRARSLLAAVEGRDEPVGAFGRMLNLLARSRFESDALRTLQRRVSHDRGSAGDALASLTRALLWSEVRYSPMIYVTLQFVLMWDLHMVLRLERWRRTHGRHAREWFAALGEFEAHAALAVLARCNPEWCFPVLSEPAAGDALRARDLGHPLIPAGVRVGNDVTVGPPGSFLLVTGSNMSGKSTLLRSIGTNVVLAQCGAPVCAAAMELPLVRLASSVQVQDSLAQGVSRFMAEVLRLRDVVAAARSCGAGNGPMVLYLLDEILQGTNSAERQAGARRVLEALLRMRCIGVVTTHDLALADTPELKSAAHAVHFTEGVEEVAGEIVLSFEYKLRPGIAESVNALKLMRAVGL